MTINDKIKQILIDKNLSPSYFADEIGVQRSSISHILSGRNRPSFDIIQKIIRRFPELGYEWIMEEESQAGRQSVPSYGNRNPGQASQERTGSPSVQYGSQQPVSVRSLRNEIPPVAPAAAMPLDTTEHNEPASNPTAGKKVERVLMFYTDGSFREFTPSV